MLLAAFLCIGLAPAAHAQIIFGVQLSEKGVEAVKEKAVTDPENMNAEMLLGLLAREGQFIYEGEEPVMAKQIVFIVSQDGRVHERIESKPFNLKPGVQPAGEYLSGDAFLAPLAEALHSEEGVFVEWFRISPIKGSALSSDSERRFPDTIFDEMDLRDRQVGLVLALAPADEEMLERVRFQPAGFAFAPLECALDKAAC